MTTGRIELGPTGRAVAANVKRMREARGLTLRALSARLKEEGRPLSADALNKIENGASDEPKQIRRVDVDDLMALASVLGVHPNALLLPHTARERNEETGQPETIEITGGGAIPARQAWEWAHGMRPLQGDSRGKDWLRFRLDALPEAWEPMPVDEYRAWCAQQARQQYERLVGQVSPKDGGDDG
ncbi:helix-turn-helix domain-containing protein [Streptomyces tibetensis]|uniref:helix-turn-helix domain-containing protein n=1 Tax=Streptomyces tibetensis TaxID=2382123 RepID=UPI0033D2AF44